MCVLCLSLPTQQCQSSLWKVDSCLCCTYSLATTNFFFHKSLLLLFPYIVSPHSSYCPQHPHRHLPYLQEDPGKPTGEEYFYDVEEGRRPAPTTPSSFLASAESSMRLAFLRKVRTMYHVTLHTLSHTHVPNPHRCMASYPSNCLPQSLYLAYSCLYQPFSLLSSQIGQCFTGLLSYLSLP